MNYPNEDLVNQMRSNTKYVKSFNYPSPNINLAKNIRKKEKIKEEKMNPEIIEFKSEENMFLKMPMPVQNLEPYKSKEKEKNLIFENKYLDKNVEYLMPKHSIKSSNSFKINTKINNKKYIGNNNQNKINDYEMFENSNNGYILYKNNSNNNISNNKINIIGTNSGKIKSKTMSNYISNNSNLKMTKSSMQISGSIPLSQSQTFNNNINNNVNKIPLSKISSVSLNIEGGNSPRKKFQKKNSENKIDINYDKIITKTKVKYIKNNNNKYINNQGYKHQTYLPKKDIINDNIKYNYNSDNLKKELKRNKINNNISNNNNLMNIDNDINFVQPNNEYNNIFFYSSKSHNINDIDENYSYNNDNNPNFQYKNNELNNVKNKYVYKKSDNLSEKQIQKLKNTYKDKIIKHNKSDTTNYKKKEIKKIVIKKQEIKNKLINNFETIDLNIKIPLGPDFSKEEKISINLKEDNIKEKIENLLNKYDLDNSYYEPILSLLNNSINIIGNVNNINLSENINLNNFNKDKLNLKENSDESFDDLNYSKVLDIQERHLYDEFIEKMYSDVDEINENAKILNMSI